MTATTPLKQRLLDHVDQQDAAGSFSDEAFEELARLVEQIRLESPVQAPMDAMDQVEGRWETEFAHFGARHSAGKPRVHDSNLKVHSFNRFPPVPVRITRMCQEISRQGNEYNNVVDFLAADGVTQGQIIVRGVYREDPDGNRQRFVVDFVRVELSPGAGVSEAELREALGFVNGEALSADMKPPRLHSDVVYLDDQHRINIGSFGGLYLLRRSAEPPVSVSLG
jgi:hypothetical protein